MALLHTQFGQALTNIEVNGRKQERAIEAHTEIQDLLASDETLRRWGVNTRLIGSYSRLTGIYPGKDVDVFTRLESLDTEALPAEVYQQVEAVLLAAYGLEDEGGRATPQDRSVKVAFPDGDDSGSDGFAVDAVPAVRDGGRWAIPVKDRARWVAGSGRWQATNPERFGELSSALSTSPASPMVGTKNAYKPIVKLMRQARRVHLGDRRPGGLYVEFATYDVWLTSGVVGGNWAELFAQTLRRVAERFGDAPNNPLLDPGLGTPVEPPLGDADWVAARERFTALADLADDALDAEECSAAANWRTILGENSRGQVFPLPPGCDGDGNRITDVAPIVGIGSDEARRFG